MHQELPGEIHLLFKRPGEYYRRRLHSMRTLLCSMSAECKRNKKRHRQSKGACLQQPSGVCKHSAFFYCHYDHVTITSMRKSLLQLGFEDVEETAAGASMVKKRYEEITGSGKQDVIVTTCCHTVNLLVQKYFPDALPYLAAVVSPMQAHCRDIKRRVPMPELYLSARAYQKKRRRKAVPMMWTVCSRLRSCPNGLMRKRSLLNILKTPCRNPAPDCFLSPVEFCRP